MDEAQLQIEGDLLALGGHLRSLKNGLYHSQENAQRAAQKAKALGKTEIVAEMARLIRELEAVQQRMENPLVQEFTADEEPIPF